MIYTVTLLKDGCYHLFFFDRRHLPCLKGESSGELVNAFRFMFPNAVCMHPDNYRRAVSQRVQERRELVKREIYALG